MKNNICCIFNVAPHYNAPIYKLMDAQLNCDFYLGDRLTYPIKLMKYDSLNGFRKTLKYIQIFGNFYWQKGAVLLSLNSYRYYILTGEPYCLSTWIILLLNKLTGKKSIVWTHGWYGNETGLKKVIKKLFFGLTNSILLYGDYAKKIMISEGFEPDKLIPIYNSLDYDKQIKIREELKETSIYKDYFLNQNPVLLFIGRIQSRKKVNLLIEAIQNFRLNDTPCNLILIGEQTEGNCIDELIEKYDLDNYVWRYGPCFEESTIGELIYNADLCVVPGDIGLTVMHSFVYGTPVLTHNNFPNHGPEFEAIEPHVTGDFFEEDSLEDLCAKIKDWISLDSKVKDSIRSKCYETISKKYNPDFQIQVLKSLVEN
jgi:glycosyltransferase involved in cell wall biosynthesis